MLLTPRIVRTHELTQRDIDPLFIGTPANLGLGGPPPLIAQPDPARRRRRARAGTAVQRAGAPPAGTAPAPTPRTLHLRARPTSAPRLPPPRDRAPCRPAPARDAAAPVGAASSACAGGGRRARRSNHSFAERDRVPSRHESDGADQRQRDRESAILERVADRHLQSSSPSRPCGAAGIFMGSRRRRGRFTEDHATPGRIDIVLMRTGDKTGAAGTGTLAALIFDAVGSGPGKSHGHGNGDRAWGRIACRCSSCRFRRSR